MDREYWDQYYMRNGGVHYPTPFAEECARRWIPAGSRILELGSGNGRDAFFFAEHGHQVAGIDQSEFITAQNSARARQWLKEDRLEFRADDFTRFPPAVRLAPNVVYSRFSMHTVSRERRDHVAREVYRLLPADGLFLVECRTTNDALINQGQRLSETETMTDHYRNFVDADEFLRLLLATGYKARFFIEDSGLAVFGNDDPVVSRYVMRK